MGKSFQALKTTSLAIALLLAPAMTQEVPAITQEAPKPSTFVLKAAPQTIESLFNPSFSDYNFTVSGETKECKQYLQT